MHFTAVVRLFSYSLISLNNLFSPAEHGPQVHASLNMAWLITSLRTSLKPWSTSSPAWHHPSSWPIRAEWCQQAETCRETLNSDTAKGNGRWLVFVFLQYWLCPHRKDNKWNQMNRGLKRKWWPRSTDKTVFTEEKQSMSRNRKYFKHLFSNVLISSFWFFRIMISMPFETWHLSWTSLIQR